MIRMKINRKKVIQVFGDYVKNYDKTDERVLLKIKHTYRVSALCDKIAVALGFSKEDVDLAWLLGMLHDIGRFEQVKVYGTFIDAESINHAQYGVGILFGQGMIRDYIEDGSEDELIQTAITYHNVYRMPEIKEKRMKVFADLLRDADKLDILKVIVETPLEVIYDCDQDELMQAEISEKVMESFLAHHAVDHQFKQNPVDFIVGHISLTFELVYPVSIKIAGEQGYLRQLLSFQSENEATKEQFARLQTDMERYIASRT